jgi:hypothetical protein
LDQRSWWRCYAGLIEYYDMPHCDEAVKTRIEATISGGLIAQHSLNCLADGAFVL